jgi:serine/threonine protein kinase
LAKMGMDLVAAAGVSASDILFHRPGTMIGRYKLLGKIGEGGFGVVFMAEQVEPVQRKVALKIIKAGMDTKEVIARFEAERQAIALMDHPNIARALDAGATEAGRPYFVMELVRGIPITEYCDQANLPTRERLQLFIKVCQAVQHAHQKGVIHRDLKPSNVLVTEHDGEPVPKVIDFGVSKALGQKLTEKTLFTAFHHLIGTPAYMSPEQAALSGSDLDTRADIYSLGVLLYELLTGVTPFDAETLRQAGLDEIRRMIRETEPLKPSTRLETLGKRLTDVAKHRHTEPATLSRLVRGDLDWIVMKCLEKDRKRRYETANWRMSLFLLARQAVSTGSISWPGGTSSLSPPLLLWRLHLFLGWESRFGHWCENKKREEGRMNPV